MINKADVLVENSDYLISLSKLVGKRVVDLCVCVSNPFGKDELLLLVYDVVLEDGSRIDVQGEHDAPYLEEYTSMPQENMDKETLKHLWDNGK